MLGCESAAEMRISSRKAERDLRLMCAGESCFTATTLFLYLAANTWFSPSCVICFWYSRSLY
jgi:hypothetical protein